MKTQEKQPCGECVSLGENKHKGGGGGGERGGPSSGSWQRVVGWPVGKSHQPLEPSPSLESLRKSKKQKSDLSRSTQFSRF